MSNDDIFITREDLRDYIHDIHNFLRNSGAGYGQTGLKIFNVFYGLKLIKPYIKTLKLTISQNNYFNWNKLVKQSKGIGIYNESLTYYIDNRVLLHLFVLAYEIIDPNRHLGKFLF